MGQFKFTEKQKQVLQDLHCGLSNKYKEVCLFGGRRSGKTFVLLDIIFTRAMVAPFSKHVICRGRYSTVKASIWEDTIKNQLMQIEKYRVFLEGCKRNEKDMSITLKNNSVIVLKGLDNTEGSLGTEFSTIYFNECSDIKFKKLEISSGLAGKREIVYKGQKRGYLPTLKLYDYNPYYKQHWTYKYFAENINPYTGLERPKEQIDKLYIKQLNPVDNTDNIDPDYIDELCSKGEDYKKRFFLGEYLDNNADAVFKREQVEQGRDHDLHGLSIAALKAKAFISKIVIGIDPAVSTNEKSDLSGVVVCGYGDGLYYILEDKSGKYEPSQLGAIVIRLCQKWKTGTVVAETNQGGSYIRENLMIAKERARASFQLEVKEVRGNNYKEFDVEGAFANPKLKRAQAVKILYDEGLVRQIDFYDDGITDINRLDALNQEMLSYDGSGKSPDRMDAMVYAMIELMQGRYLNDTVTLNRVISSDDIVEKYTRALMDRDPQILF